MAGLAKSLPVTFIPHQMRITTVRNDMVDYSCCCEPSPCHTLHAQRMLPQVRLTEPLPPAAIATLGSRRSVWVQGLMLCTVQTVCQIGTAGMLAWFQCLPWHKVHLRIQRKPMWNTTGLSVSFLRYYYIMFIQQFRPSNYLMPFRTKAKQDAALHDFSYCKL